MLTGHLCILSGEVPFQTTHLPQKIILCTVMYVPCVCLFMFLCMGKIHVCVCTVWRPEVNLECWPSKTVHFIFFFFFLRHHLSLGPGAHQSGYARWCVIPRDSLLFISPSLGLQDCVTTASISPWYWGTSSSLPVCTVGTLLTELSH